MLFHREHQQIMVYVVKEALDIQVNRPAASPTSSSCCTHRIKR
jgi:hypothetical protein